MYGGVGSEIFKSSNSAIDSFKSTRLGLKPLPLLDTSNQIAHTLVGPAVTRTRNHQATYSQEITNLGGPIQYAIYGWFKFDSTSMPDDLFLLFRSANRDRVSYQDAS